MVTRYRQHGKDALLGDAGPKAPYRRTLPLYTPRATNLSGIGAEPRERETVGAGAHWSKEGANALEPAIYKEYIRRLYRLSDTRLATHAFLNAMASALSYTPFSPEKVVVAMRDMQRGESIRRVEIDISDACNFRCSGCTFKFRSSDQMLPWSALVSIARALRGASVRAITLVGGGDPSQYASEGRRLPDVTELLHEHGFDVFLVTNAFDLTDDGDVERILSTVRGLRVSYYETIYNGEPANKNEIVKANIERLLRVRSRIGSGAVFNIANLLAFNKPRDYDLSIELARAFGIAVTPRPYIAIERSAKCDVPEEVTERALWTTLQNYERIAPLIGPETPIAAREFLERILAFSLPFNPDCSTTKLGLIGKLRANGDLYRCGQLSTVSPEKRRLNGLEDDELFRSLLDDPREGVATNVAGHPGLASFGSCPTCRESLNNARFQRFASLPAAVRDPVECAAQAAFDGGRNLGWFW